MDIAELERLEDESDGDQRYTVEGFGGVAVWYAGREVERYWDLDEGIDWSEPEERTTGRVLVVMVGDDRRHSVEPEDLTPIDDEDYCGGCGQVGCGWG